MIDLFSANVCYSFLFTHTASQRRVARSGLAAGAYIPRNATMPRPAFTRLVRGAAIQLNSP